MVITSKHHDGFAIYRSQVSDYDMKFTPYSGDPLKQLTDAARQKGMPVWLLPLHHGLASPRLHPEALLGSARHARRPAGLGRQHRYLHRFHEGAAARASDSIWRRRDHLV